MRKPLADQGGTIDVTLSWLPGQITARCDQPGVHVQIDGKAARLDTAIAIPIDNTTTGYRNLEVAFFTDDGKKFKKQQIKLRYKQSKDVQCAF